MTNKGVHSYYDVENFYKNTPELHNNNESKIASFLSEVDHNRSYPVEREDPIFLPRDDSDDDLYA